MKILIVGYGNMGKPMVETWEKARLFSEAIVVSPTQNDEKGEIISLFSDPDRIPESFDPDFVVLCVKPQMMQEVLVDYVNYAKRSVFLSIAVGLSTSFFERCLGKEARIVRAMPNLGTTYGAGMTTLFAKNITDSQRESVNTLFRYLGEVLWVKEEKMIDITSSISGSGPAYFYLFVESLIEAAMAQGMNHQEAGLLAKQTFWGSALVLKKSGIDLSELRSRVTSQKGTTEKAIQTMESTMKKIVRKGVESAIKRAEEIASES